MDDGSVSFSEFTGNVSSAAFHTEGFTEPEQDLMVEWFRSRGYGGVVKAKSKGYWYLYAPRPDAEKLVARCAPFVPDEMRYKVEVHRG